MWRQITISYDPEIGGFDRVREEKTIDGSLDQIKLILSLQDFSYVREMYIMDEACEGSVKIYRVIRSGPDIGDLEFQPIAFHTQALEPFCKGESAKALVNLRAMTERKAGEKIKKLLETIQIT